MIKLLFSFFMMLLPMAASAESVRIGYLYYNLDVNNRTASVAENLRGGYSGNVVIPETVTYDGTDYIVTSIGNDAFWGNSELTSITIPNSVTTIESCAFLACSRLTTLTIPNSVTKLGEQAFSRCSSLSSITIPNSVFYIGNEAFNETPWYNNQPEGLVYAGKVAYSYKGTMPDNTKIELDENTTGIAGSAFLGCRGLTSISIPSNVISIGNSAFKGCSGLTSLSIPNSVTFIDWYAFEYCI